MPEQEPYSTFNAFYVNWYSRMKHFAREYVISEEDAEDIVQDIFMEVYEVYEKLTNHANLVAYLFTAIRNRCIDHLRRKIVAEESFIKIHEEQQLILRMKFDSLEALDPNLLKDGNLEQILEQAMQSLPERCRLIFIRHKIDGKKLKEIATELDISVKTVENQITIAYKKLREQLKNYTPLLLLYF